MVLELVSRQISSGSFISAGASSSRALFRGLLLKRLIATNDRDSLFSCHRFMRRWLSVWPSNFSNVYLLLESVSGIEPMSAETMNLRSNHQSMGDHPPQHDREKKRGSGLSCRKQSLNQDCRRRTCIDQHPAASAAGFYCLLQSGLQSAEHSRKCVFAPLDCPSRDLNPQSRRTT